MRDSLWLLVAGFGGGVLGSAVGLASLVSYPALLAVGLSPLSANVSNTTALVFGAVGSISASGEELRGQLPRARRLGLVAVAGGISGGLLLLVTPAGAFVRLVPWLIGGASLAILIGRSAGHRSQAGARKQTLPLNIGVFFVAIYGGYFGAAAGVVLVALLLIVTGDTLPRSNAMKNLLLGLVNAVAAIAFVAFGPVRWYAVVPLASGFLLGGRVGPLVVRKVPERAMRMMVACAGIGLSVHLAIDAYR